MKNSPITPERLEQVIPKKLLDEVSDIFEKNIEILNLEISEAEKFLENFPKDL
jgi:hypothetical protein